MEYRDLLVVLITVLGGSESKETQVGLLVEGSEISYGSQVNITSFDLDIEINFNAEAMQKVRTGLEEVLQKFMIYTPFKTDKKLEGDWKEIILD